MFACYGKLSDDEIINIGKREPMNENCRISNSIVDRAVLSTEQYCQQNI